MEDKQEALAPVNIRYSPYQGFLRSDRTDRWRQCIWSNGDWTTLLLHYFNKYRTGNDTMSKRASLFYSMLLRASSL